MSPGVAELTGPPARAPPHGDDRAASPLVSFLVALGLFGMMAWTVLALEKQVGTPAAENSDVASVSAGIAEVLLGAGAPSSWGETNAATDSLARLGVGDARGRVLQEKLARLHGAGLASGANGKVDYEEARVALGLSKYDFHVRTHPLFDPFGSSYFGVAGLADSRVAYVGDYVGAVESAASSSESATLDAFPLLFDNTAFSASSPGAAGDKFPDDKSTLETHLVLRLAGWARTEGGVVPGAAGVRTWTLYDDSDVSSFAPIPAGTHVVGIGTTGAPGYGADENDRLVSAPIDLRGTAPRLVVREWIEGECLTVLGVCASPLDYAVVEVSHTGVAGSWIEPAPLERPTTTGGAWRNRTIDLASCVPCKTGPVHLGLRWVSNGNVHRKGWLVDEVRLEDARNGRLLWTNDAELGTAHYQTLVVGSDVDQTALNSASVKFRLRDWVSGGGQLLVFGSTASSDEWMQPVFGAGLSTGANGPAYAPDSSHPLLVTPNQLSYRTYPTDGGVWRINLAHQAKFAQVVGKAPPKHARDRDDELSVTVPGAYGEGTVILTTYLPYRMAGDEDSKLIANFLMYGRYGVLYLDYGMPVPGGKAVGTTSRLALASVTIDDGPEVVEVRLTVQAWRR